MSVMLAPIPTLAFEFNSATALVIAVVGIVLLGVCYFAIRFWLVSTRPPDIREIDTPSLDRLNHAALEHMADRPDRDEDPGDNEDDDVDDADEVAEGLKSALPEEPK